MKSWRRMTSTSKSVCCATRMLRTSRSARWLPALVARTREHHLDCGGETGVLTNALDRPQNMVVRAVPIPSMTKVGIGVVPGTITTHEVFLEAALRIREWSEDTGLLVNPKY
jgi:hypothetical protein